MCLKHHPQQAQAAIVSIPGGSGAGPHIVQFHQPRTVQFDQLRTSLVIAETDVTIQSPNI